MALARRDEHDAPRVGDRGDTRRRLGADRMIDQHRVPVPLREHVGEMRREVHRARAPARQPPLDQRGFDAGGRDDQHRPAGEIGRRGAGARPPSAGGSGTMARKLEPSPGALSTSMRPPMRSTMRREIARPEPGAAELAGRAAVGLLEFAEDARLLLRRDADAGVAHLEDDFSAAGPASTMTPTPPVSVNLMALPARLSSTWRKRVASPMTRSGSRSSTSEAISRPLACARGPSSSTTSSTRSVSENGCVSSSSLPASILEKSRISSISDSSASPEVLVALT